MQWKKYPIGAHTDILDGFIRILITKVEDGFEGILFANWGGGKGINIIGKGKTINEAIKQTERWLAEQTISMFQKEKK